MSRSRDIHSEGGILRQITPAKIARMVLVFILAFYGTLHVEVQLAIAAERPADGSVTNIVVYETYTDGDTTHRGADGHLVRDTVVTTRGDAQEYTPQIQSVQGSMEFVALAQWTDESGESHLTDASEFVEWSVGDEWGNPIDYQGETPVATIDARTGWLTATGTADGTVFVTCKFAPGNEALVNQAFYEENPGATFRTTLKTDIIFQSGPYVTSIELLGEDGAPLGDDISLEAMEGDQLSYGFQALVTAFDPATGESATFTVTPELGLAAASQGYLPEVLGGALPDLTWYAAPAEGSEEGSAAIDEMGRLTIAKGASATVTCTSYYGQYGGEMTDSVYVTTGTAEPENPYDIADATIAVASPHKYTGNAIEPPVTVTLGENQLLEGTDYTLAFADNIEPGTATVTVTGTGEYTGEAKAEFKISNSLEDATIAEIGPKKFTGKPIEPEVTLQIGGDELVPDTDYTLTYENNVEAGTATVTATGTGLFTGTATAEFIISNSLEDATMSNPGPQMHTGKPIEPEVTLKIGEDELVLDTDYTLTYENNVDVGIATVTATGTGDFTGEKSLEFEITENPDEPEKPEEPEGPDSPVLDDDGELRVAISYTPTKLGQTAVFSPVTTGTQKKRFGYLWEESTDGGKTWDYIVSTSVMALMKPTTAEYIGNFYRVTVVTEDDREAVSAPVQLVEGDGYSLILSYEPVAHGQTAVLTVTSGEPVKSYEWQESLDGGANWKTIEDATRQSYAVETAEGNLGKWYRVQGTFKDGTVKYSNTQMLVARVNDPEEEGDDDPTDEQPGDGGDSTDPSETVPPDDPTDDPSDNEPIVPPDDPTDDPSDEPIVPPDDPSDNIPTEDEPTPIPDDNTPPTRAVSEDGTEYTFTPIDNVVISNGYDPVPKGGTTVIVDYNVSDQIAAEEVTVLDQPVQMGARWRKLSVTPDQNQIEKVLEDNPFATFAFPFMAGTTAAGVVEKIVEYRRQKRTPGK